MFELLFHGLHSRFWKMFWWKDGTPVSWEWQSQVQFVKKFHWRCNLRSSGRCSSSRRSNSRGFEAENQGCRGVPDTIRHRWYLQQYLNIGENRVKQLEFQCQSYNPVNVFLESTIVELELLNSICPYFSGSFSKSGRGKIRLTSSNMYEIEPPFNSTSLWFHKHFGPDFVFFSDRFFWFVQPNTLKHLRRRPKTAPSIGKRKNPVSWGIPMCVVFFFDVF